MANQNTNPNQNPNPNSGVNGSDLFTSGTTNLWPVPAAAFTIPGYIPVSCTFRIPRDQLENDILSILKNFSKDFTLVRFEISPSTHQISLWAWIKSSSPDIVDTRFRDRSDFIIQTPMMNMSQKMKALQNIFGIRSEKKKDINGNPSSEENIRRRFNFVQPTNGDRRYLGVQLDILSVLRELLDSNDTSYKKLYDKIGNGNYSPNNYVININPITDRDGKCTSFIITKKVRENRDARSLHPKQAYRLND